MTRLGRRTALLASLLLAAPAAGQTRPAAADLHTHGGYWIGFAVAPGFTQTDCASGCGATGDTPRAWKSGSGMGFTLSMGGTPRSNLLLGGELGGVVRQLSQTTATVGWGAFVAQYYPRPRSGFFLRGGLGLGAASLESEPLDLTTDYPVATPGFSVQAGLGYDVRFGGRFALTPMAQYVMIVGDGAETVRHGTRYVGPSNPSAVLVGLSFNWY